MIWELAQRFLFSGHWIIRINLGNKTIFSVYSAIQGIQEGQILTLIQSTLEVIVKSYYWGGIEEVDVETTYFTSANLRSLG